MKQRNCHLAMHLAGNRGAGQHKYSYHIERHMPLLDSDAMSDDELQEYILTVIGERERRGIYRHYSANFLPAARHSDIIYCLDTLVEKKLLRVSREYECSICRSKVLARAPADSWSSNCCTKPALRMVSEFFSS